MAKAKILVVEDEAITAKDLQDRLRGLGYDAPTIAASGEGAIKRVEEIEPDLVVMDIILKGMDGIEAAEQIHDRFDIPVVYVTAYLDEERLEKTKVTEPYGYITKPFEDKELRPVIEMALQRHTLEKAIKKSEERYKTLFEFATDGILIADIETRAFNYANPAICRMLGYSLEELKGMGVSEIHPKDKLGHVISEFEAQARGEKALAPNIPCLRKDGTVIYADINTTRASIDGKDCNMGFFRDITERKRAEEALRESEAQKQALLDSSPDMIMQIDMNMKILWANKTALDMNLEVIGQTGHKAFVDLDEPCEDCPCKKAIDTGQIEMSVNYQPAVAGVQGESYWEDIGVPLKDSDGRVVSVIEIARNVTERKQMEEKQSVFSHAVDSSIDGLAMGDLEGRITYVNDAFVRMFGYSREELIGNEIGFIYPENQLPKLEKALKATMDGGWIGELVAKRKNGELFPIAISSSLIKDDEGNVIAHMASHQDISERKRAEEELKKKNKELELFNRLAVGRELKMIELKKEINALLEDLGKEPRYEIAGEEDKKNYEL